MAMSNADRQAKFRRGQEAQGIAGRGPSLSRLDLRLAAIAHHRLRVLAQLHHTTLREELERLITEATEAAKKAVSKEAWVEAAQAVMDPQ